MYVFNELDHHLNYVDEAWSRGMLLSFGAEGRWIENAFHLFNFLIFFACMRVYFIDSGGPWGPRGSSLGQNRVSYGALRRSWDLPFRIELKMLPLPSIGRPAETSGTYLNHLV